MPLRNIPEWKRENIELARRELVRQLAHEKRIKTNKAVEELLKRFDENKNNPNT